jgi:hypothetical protein
MLSRYVPTVFSEWFWDDSSCLYYYWHHLFYITTTTTTTTLLNANYTLSVNWIRLYFLHICFDRRKKITKSVRRLACQSILEKDTIDMATLSLNKSNPMINTEAKVRLRKVQETNTKVVLENGFCERQVPGRTWTKNAFQRGRPILQRLPHSAPSAAQT